MRLFRTFEGSRSIGLSLFEVRGMQDATLASNLSFWMIYLCRIYLFEVECRLSKPGLANSPFAGLANQLGIHYIALTVIL